MNNFYKLFLLLFIFLISEFSHAGLPPTFNMVTKNIVTFPGTGQNSDRDSILEFDVYCQQTNFGQANVDPFEYCCGQWAWYFNPAIINGPPQNNVNLFFTLRSSSLPSSLVPPSTAINNGLNLLQTSGNLPNSSVNWFISSVFPGTFMAKYRLRTSQRSWNVQPLNLRTKVGPAPNTFIAYFLPYADTIDTDVFPPPQQFAFSLMDTVTNVYTVEGGNVVIGTEYPIANFYSNTRIVNPGESVNFQDSSLRNPTSWNWSFPGGTPASSTQQNPSGIVYNTPGTYSVTLTVSNQFGQNTKTKSDYITVGPPPCIPDWFNTIKITDAANMSDSLKFGTSPLATDGIDPCFGEAPLPPPPPTEEFDVRFKLPVSIDSKIDIRNVPVINISWTINLKRSVSGPVAFTWNQNAFPSNGQFYLKDIVGGGGGLVNVNMKTQNSYTLTLGIDILKIEHQYLNTISIPVDSSWNMISVPLRQLSLRVSDVFPNASSYAFKYQNNNYVIADSLFNSKGYWLKFHKDTNYINFGFLVSPKNIPVVTGWNMIGPFDENIPVTSIVSTPPGIITANTFYGYSRGYFHADTLKPGKGYWVNVTAPGVLSKMTSDIAGTGPVVENRNDRWTRISIKDNSNNASDLYLANSMEISQSYDLPPTPPQSVFDIRFSSNKSVEPFGSDHIVNLNSVTRPLKITAYNLNNNILRIKDAVTGNLFNVVLQEGEEIELGLNLDNLVITEETILPVQYSLSQNYPNPFNPSTTIKYELPQDGFVKIVIYDVLGKEVQTLYNNSQKAGKHDIRFNASDLASGVYFYKMQSGEFSEIKRMLLMK